MKQARPVVAICFSAGFPPVLKGQWVHLIQWYKFTCKDDANSTRLYSSLPYTLDVLYEQVVCGNLYVSNTCSTQAFSIFKYENFTYSFHKTMKLFCYGALV